MSSGTGRLFVLAILLAAECRRLPNAERFPR
jgi:hypothetical protein